MSTVIVRPASASALGWPSSWSGSGGTASRGRISDGADGTWVSSNAGGDEFAVGFTSPASGSQVVRSSQLFVRWRRTQYVVGARAEFAGSTAPGPSAAATTVTTSAAAVSGWAGDATIYTDYFEYGYSGTLTIYDVWLSAVVAEPPTAAVTAPSGAVGGSSQPQIVTTHTAGSDGGPRTFTDVRVFTSAQAAIGGFDPGASPATWEARNVIGAGTTFTPDPLANGGHTVYVRTAQTVGSTVQWSAWASSTFTLTGTPPAITSVVATADDAAGRIGLTVSRDTSGPAWSSFDLERSCDGGTTWRRVTGSPVTPTSDVWTGSDFEAPNGQSVTYRARPRSTVSATGSWTNSAAVSWVSGDVWLRDVVVPSRSQKVTVTKLLAPKWGIEQDVHVAAGRPDPVVVSDVRQFSRGRLLLEVHSLDDERALLALYNGQVLLLSLPAGWAEEPQTYLVVGAVSRDRPDTMACSEWRQFDLEYVEVAAP